jgi:hypothetical protein
MRLDKSRFVSFQIVSLFVLVPVMGFGQEKDSAKAGKPKEEANILIVPFKPDMYNASGDQYICQQSHMTPGELSDLTRRSLITTLMYNMSDLYNVVEPPDQLRDKKSDLSVLYEIIRFKTLYKRVKSYYKAYPAFTIGKLLSARYIRWGTDCVNDNAQKPNVISHKYVKAEVTKDSIYSLLCKKYNAHYTLFLTQYEMVTRFKNCTDLQNNVFQRDIFIHYTLLDKNGKFIQGGVVGTTFQSSTNDATKILEKNLGLLTGLIVDEIRKRI